MLTPQKCILRYNNQSARPTDLERHGRSSAPTEVLGRAAARDACGRRSFPLRPQSRSLLVFEAETEVPKNLPRNIHQTAQIQTAVTNRQRSTYTQFLSTTNKRSHNTLNITTRQEKSIITFVKEFRQLSNCAGSHCCVLAPSSWNPPSAVGAESSPITSSTDDLRATSNRHTNTQDKERPGDKHSFQPKAECVFAVNGVIVYQVQFTTPSTQLSIFRYVR